MNRSFVQIRSKSRQGCTDRISWCLWVTPFLVMKAKLTYSSTSDGLASGIQHGAVERIPGKAINVYRSAPLLSRHNWCPSDRNGGPRYPTWRIELHLHKCGSRMFADRVWGVGVWVVEYIAIAIRCACHSPRIGIRLRITHRHAEPERRVQLKVEGLLAQNSALPPTSSAGSVGRVSCHCIWLPEPGMLE